MPLTHPDDILRGLWSTLRAPTPDGARARRRAAVMTAVATFVLLLLVAIGFGTFVLIALAAVASASVPFASLLFVRRFGRRLGTHATAMRRSAQAAVRGRVAGMSSAATSGRQRLTKHLHVRAPRRDPLADRRTAAVNANARGAQLRRIGNYAGAVELHRLALKIYRELGDRHAEALTLNNLGLALDHSGDPSALTLLEDAATILGALGDEQHEGKVIANLALALRRRGSESECTDALETALDKLDPQTSAYRRVESLRRAS